MTTNRSAAIDPGTLTVIAVIALAVALAAPSGARGKKHFWEFWKKDPIAQAQTAAAAVDEAKAKADTEAAAAKAAVDAQREKQLKVAQEAAIATGAAIEAAQVTTAAGSMPVKELETAKTLNKTNTHAMDQAIGAAAPERIRELEAMVRDLNAGVAAGAKALDLMQGALDAAVKDRAAAQAQLVKVESEGKAAIALAERARDEAVKREQAWAADRDAIARQYERLTFWSKVGGVIVALIVAYAVFLMWRLGVLGRFGKDMVGMTEMLKTEVKTRASSEEYAALKERMRTDWMTASDGTAALVDKLKAELRL